MRILGVVSLILSIVGSGLLAAEQPKVKRVPARMTTSISGADLYREYCAVCHGRDGKGTGPAAEALKAMPTDLTQITRRNGGKYPEVKVQRTIAGQELISAHGSEEMPVWGPIFRHMSANEDLGAMRIYNLVKYIESIQK